MKVYVLYNQRFCEIRGVYSTHELAMENAEYGTDFVFECELDQCLYNEPYSNHKSSYQEIQLQNLS